MDTKKTLESIFGPLTRKRLGVIYPDDPNAVPFHEQFQQDLKQGFGDAGRLVQRGIQEAKNRPEVRMVTEPAGAVMGAASGAIGGTIGALGNFFQNSLQGKGFDPQTMGRDIANTAGATGQFGYGLGKEAAFNAPIMAAGGSIPSAMLSASNIGTGVEKGLEGDYTGAGIDLGLGALGAYGAAKQAHLTPGGILDKALNDLLSKVGTMTPPIPGAGSIQDASRSH